MIRDEKVWGRQARIRSNFVQRDVHRDFGCSADLRGPTRFTNGSEERNEKSAMKFLPHCFVGQ